MISIENPDELPFLQFLSTSGANCLILLSDLPHCPECTNLLRPGVVWFGEKLSAGAPDNVEQWLQEEGVELVIAAGTSLEVFPAAEWVGTARENGASLVVVDLDIGHHVVEGLGEGDLVF